MFNFTVGNAKAILRAAHNKLKKYPEDDVLAKMDDDDLLAVINMSEELALAGREAYIEPPYMDEAGYKRNMEKYDELLNIVGVVGFSPEGHFRVVVPPLINRRRKRYGTSYYSYSDLLARVRCSDVQLTAPGRHIFVYKRYIVKPDSKRCMDNENVDAHNLTNAACMALGLSDRAMAASFVYSAVKSSVDRDELTVIPYSQMGIIPAILEPTEPQVFTHDGDEISIPQNQFMYQNLIPKIDD